MQMSKVMRFQEPNEMPLVFLSNYSNEKPFQLKRGVYLDEFQVSFKKFFLFSIPFTLFRMMECKGVFFVLKGNFKG